MKMHEPIGHESYGPFFVRVALGSYVMIAGYSKIHHIPELVEQVKKFNILPEHLAQLYGMFLPYLAIGAGVMLVIGMWTTLAAILSSLMIGSFIYAFKEYPNSVQKLFDRDIILFACALSLLYTGSGAFSIDKFRKSG